MSLYNKLRFTWGNLCNCLHVYHLMDPCRFGSTDVVLAELLFRWLKSRTGTRERHNERKGEARFWRSRPTAAFKAMLVLSVPLPIRGESRNKNTEPLLEQDWTGAMLEENAKANKLSPVFTPMWTVIVLNGKISPFTGIS